MKTLFMVSIYSFEPVHVRINLSTIPATPLSIVLELFATQLGLSHFFNVLRKLAIVSAK